MDGHLVIPREKALEMATALFQLADLARERDESAICFAAEAMAEYVEVLLFDSI